MYMKKADAAAHGASEGGRSAARVGSIVRGTIAALAAHRGLAAVPEQQLAKLCRQSLLWPNCCSYGAAPLPNCAGAPGRLAGARTDSHVATVAGRSIIAGGTIVGLRSSAIAISLVTDGWEL